jgi:hypothetical protein
MNVQWGAYPNNIGHNCNSCHQLLAVEETNPEILGKLGVQ